MAKRLGFINLRKEIRALLREVGFYWMALRSADLTQRCVECSKKIPANYDQAPRFCPQCFNTGYLFRDELVKGFRYLSQPGLDFLSEGGPLNIKTQVFILEHDEFPKSVDYLLELDLHEETGVPRQPFKITKAHKIQDAQPMRGDDGRIEFWRCFTEERSLGLGRTIAEH